MIALTSSRISSRIVSASLAMAIAACASLAIADGAPTTAPATAPATTQASTQPLVLGPVIATVNGEEISRDLFNSVNTEMHGVDLLRLLESCILADKACKDAGIPVGAAQDQAEKDRMLEGVAQMGFTTKEQQESALAQIMISRGVSQVEFSLTLHRAACLRALAKNKTTVEDADIQDAFDAKYGKRVRFRDIQVKTLMDGSDVLHQADKEHRPIMEIVAERNLPMNSYDWNEKLKVPEKQVKDTAFQLEEHQLSSVLTIESTDPKGNPVTSYHILYVEKKIPADKDAKLDDAMKNTLKKLVTEQKEAQWGQQQMDRLLTNAHVEIKDPYLQGAFQEMINRQKFMNAAATQRAATQPATSTAPAATPK